MQIKVGRYHSPWSGKKENYLIGVVKADGRKREYLVEINPLHSAMYFLFTNDWPQFYVENFIWMISFYPHDALFSLNQSGRFGPDSKMAFTRRELESLMIEGIGGAIADFMQRHQPALLVAVAIRENLGRLYHRLLIRHAAGAGYIYHQTYVQEALYVLEIKRKSAHPQGLINKIIPRRGYRAVVGLPA